VDLDAVTIELDFVEPLLTLRRFSAKRCKLRLDEAGHISGFGTHDYFAN
jgi:hypothetical protein